MSEPFNSQHGLIIVPITLDGPSGTVVVQAAVDTGATSTLINVGLLVAIGYDPALSPTRLQVTTGSGVEYVPQIVISRVTALGQQRVAFPVLAHTLPPTAAVDGLLGLDFLRGFNLNVDFRAGQISLT
jgi:predicted aspartyl protease